MNTLTISVLLLVPLPRDKAEDSPVMGNVRFCHFPGDWAGRSPELPQKRRELPKTKQEALDAWNRNDIVDLEFSDAAHVALKSTRKKIGDAAYVSRTGCEDSVFRKLRIHWPGPSTNGKQAEESMVVWFDGRRWLEVKER